MASTTILSDNGVSSGSAGIKTTGGDDGKLLLQTTTAGGAATTAMTIDTSQNVGIGTSSPAYPLDVVAAQIRQNSASALGTRMSFVNTATNGRTYQIGSNFVTGTGEFAIYDATAGATRLAVDSSGNVSIGTSSAAGKLNIYNTANAYFELASNGRTLGTTSMLYGQDTAGTGYVWNRENSPVVIGTNNSTRVTVDAVGSVLLNSSSAYLYFNNTSQFIRGGGGTQVIVGASSGGFYQQVGGSYYLVTTAGGSTSDETLKTNIQPIQNALAKVCAISGITYEFIDEPMCDADKGQQIGVGAQTVEAQFPEIVLTQEDGKKTVRYDRLVAPLIEAIKEQQALINNLTERLTALEGAQA